MITNKIKNRHLFLFILIVTGLVLSLIGLALFRGEQYHVVAEEFLSVFYFSIFGTIIFGISFIIGIAYLRR
jgi:hypothetical protein